MKSHSVAYFAYGSNMDINQMWDRVGFEGEPHQGILTGYKLVFNKYAAFHGCNAANLVYTGNVNDVVEGVVYDLKPSQLDKLDRNEGIHSHQPGRYHRKSINLTDGSVIITYIAHVTQPRDVLPSVDYMKHLLAGRKSGCLSQGYFDELLEIDVKEGGKIKDHILVENYIPQ